MKLDLKMALAIAGAILPFVAPARASTALDVTPITASVVMLHLVDGRARHETLGNGFDGMVTLEPLDVAKAADAASYNITSTDDATYQTARHPQGVGRKSRGREFVKEGGKYPYVPEHWIFLRLGQPMKNGKNYSFAFGRGLVSGKQVLMRRFDDKSTRSEAVHVNQIGYRPDALKYAYLSQWMGDMGPLNLDAFDGKPFHVVEEKSGRVAFTGKVSLRRRLADGPETGQKDLPGQSMPFAGADVFQCDFSSFATPGRYRVAVDGIGSSFPFEIGADVYRVPTQTVLRGLWHQRCHVALDAKYTDHPRAACHTLEQSKFLQTTLRAIDKQYHDGKQNEPVETTDERRTVTFGWHDAGDWDHEPWHAEAIQTLITGYECAPQNWSDGDERTQDSGNGIPDIIDEAMWAANLYKQLQRPDGSTSAGTFADWWPRDGQTSTTDTMTYYVYAPDPQATLRWAAIGARLSTILTRLKQDKLAHEYLDSSVKAWDWALKNTSGGDEHKVRDDRATAAAALFQATGEDPYLQAFKNDFRIKIGEPLMIWGQFDLRWAAWTYAFCDRPNRDVELQKTVVTLCRNYTDVEYLQTAEKRSFRKGYNWWKGTMWGAGTNPDGLALMVSHALSRDPKYLQALANNCDVSLGGNALNMTWVTGLGARNPREILRIEDWHGPWTKPDAPMNPVAGILIEGPHAFAGDPDPKNPAGPWDIKFNQATAYPAASLWPSHELYFEDRYNAAMNEFTVADLAVAIASFGYLRAPVKPATARATATAVMRK